MDAVVEAFDDHAVVAIGEIHGSRHGRRALVIAGAGHVRRTPGAESPRSMTDELEASDPGVTWTMIAVDGGTIRNLADEIGPWKRPSVAAALLLADGPLADVPADMVFDRGTVTCDTPPCEDPEAAVERLGDITDALLLPEPADCQGDRARNRKLRLLSARA